MTAYQLNTEVKNRLYRLFDKKQNEEISMVCEILPIIRDTYIYTPMKAESLYGINEAVCSTLMWFRNNGIIFSAIPQFEFDSSIGTIVLSDVIYKRI